MIDLNWLPYVRNTTYKIRTNPFISQWVLMFHKYRMYLIGPGYVNGFGDNDNKKQ